MAPILDDARLHEFVGGHPDTVEQLRRRYVRLAAGRSPDGEQRWLNWIVRHRATGGAVGTVQATLLRASGRSAEIAWVIASRHQRQGYAKEAAGAMVAWLREQGVRVFVAHVHPMHAGSIAVATHLGLTPTDVSVDGETRWTRVIRG